MSQKYTSGKMIFLAAALFFYIGYKSAKWANGLEISFGIWDLVIAYCALLFAKYLYKAYRAPESNAQA